MSKYDVALITRDVADREVVRRALEPTILHLVDFEPHDSPAAIADSVGILFWDAEFPDWPWKRLLARIRSEPDRPRFVLLTSAPHPTLWAEAINLGADDVLVKPLDANEIRHVIGCADLRKKPGSERMTHRDAAALRASA